MTTLLRYDITTDPFPLQASASSGNLNSATLTIVASNPDPSTPVTLQGLIFTFPIGSDAADLTADSNDIVPVTPSGWQAPSSQSDNGSVQYTFYPKKGDGNVGRGGLSFVFNTKVNSQPGTVEIEVSEGSNDCQPPYCPTSDLFVTKFPTGWGKVSFWVDPADVPQGGSTTLHWAGPEGATYSIEYYDAEQGEVVNVPGQGQPPLSNEGQYPAGQEPPLALAQTTTFTLKVSDTVDGQTYETQEQQTATVDVPLQLEISNFDCSADAFGVGDVITLSWQVQMADSCLMEVNEGSGSVSVAAVDDESGAWNSCQVVCEDGVTLVFKQTDGTGAELGRITLPTSSLESLTFKLSATKNPKVVQQTFTIDLLPPQIISFDGSVTFDESNFEYTLSLKWETARSSSAAMSDPIGSVPTNGDQKFVVGWYTNPMALVCEGFVGPRSKALYLSIYGGVT